MRLKAQRKPQLKAQWQLRQPLRKAQLLKQPRRKVAAVAAAEGRAGLAAAEGSAEVPSRAATRKKSFHKITGCFQ